MADKNLHDIKIDELDSPKKTPLKNILTLVALLFIILVISLVITKLILTTDEGETLEGNDSKKEILGDLKENNKSEDTTESEEGLKDSASLTPSTITERNISSSLKAPLISHLPKKVSEELKTTYKAPKKNTPPKEEPVKAAPAPKKVVTNTQPKKQYIEKVDTKPAAVKTTPVKNVHFLGGSQKPVSNSYYIKAGTYRDYKSLVSKIKKNNFNYSVVKVENDKTLTRVLVGPFFSRNQAKSQLAKVQANIAPDAYITKQR